jgi:hypothetical protein
VLAIRQSSKELIIVRRITLLRKLLNDPGWIPGSRLRICKKHFTLGDSVFQINENKSSRQHLNGNHCVIILMRRLNGCRRCVKHYNNISDHHGFQATILREEVEVVI